MPISNQKEEIDSRILRLIGLEDVFDLDYETYLTLIKEAMVKGRMTKKTIPTEEIMLLTDEYKRVKSKKDNGRFEVKKKKITAGSFSIGGIKGQITGTATKALPGAAIGTSPLTKSLENNISAIASAVLSISETLKQQKKISDDTSAYNRKKAEQEKRGLAESKLEKRFEGLKKAAEKIIAPVKSLLDRIIQFFTTVLLGRIVYKLVEWFGDEKNASKVKSIIRFVKDWWPALLGSYILFGTSFGRFIRGTVGIIGRFIFQIGKVAIPKLLGLIRANPLIAAGVVTGLAAGGAEMWRQKEESNLINKEAKKRNVSPEVVKREKTKSDSGFFGLLGQGFSKIGPLGYSGGGFASGFVSGQKGVDKIPAMLSDGEFVMSRGAVEKYGVDTLEAMNAAGGGTNKPKIVSGVPYAAGGGYIGGVGELRKKYDAKHGEGAYDKESARRRAEYNKIESPREAITRMRSYEGPAKAPVTPKTPKAPKAPKINIQAPNITLSVDPKRESEREARKKARAEYLSVIKNMDHPDYDKAWNDPNYMKNLRQKYMSQATASTPASVSKPTSMLSSSKPGAGYTPYKSKFAGYRDAAFARAQDIGSKSGINPYNPMTWGRPGGVFGGPRMQARTDYAASKGKYYSSSDQKTYGNYNDAMAAKKSRMTSLASQQRLNKLSAQGAGPKTGRGIRYTTEAVASERERIKRGGIMGQLGRLGTQMFGGESGRQRIAAEDKASQARVKQAGAASIGRYYSSSDGKYYKDYNAAKLAKEQRKKSGVRPPVKPKPKYNPAGGGMGGARGSKGSKSKVKTPKFSASTKGSKTKADLIGVHR